MHPLQSGFRLATLLLALFSIAADSANPKSTGPFGVPDDDSIAKATRLIKQTFAQEYFSATTLPQRSALAQRLLKEAQDTTDNPPVRYVLLTESRDLAAKSADAPTACRAIDLLSQVYGLAPGEMTVAALSTASRIALTPQNQESLTRSALTAADQALSSDDYDLAARLAALAQAAAVKTKRIILITEAEEKQKEITWAAKEFAQAKAALETLTIKPDDPTAKSAAGRFKCLVKNDWDHGLALLIECDDPAFKLLAEKDQAAATAGPRVQAEIGDQWWDLGDKYLFTACRYRKRRSSGRIMRTKCELTSCSAR